jgi:hypothetical protein
MDRSFSVRRIVAVLGVVVVIAAAAAWHQGLSRRTHPRTPANAIMIIMPYRYSGTWVFDDDRVGLVREPFVAGVPEMIDTLVSDTPDAENGFRLFFSAGPFPGYQKKLTWVRGDSGGNYYRTDDPPMEGWLCPALMRYYDAAPKEIYVKAESKQ